MPRNMVIGKLKYWIAPRPEHTSPPSLNVVLMQPHASARRHTSGMDSCSRGRWACSVKRELKGKVTWAKRDVDPHACVLGLPGQVNKFDSNRPLLTVWDCLTLLPHRVRSGRWWWWWIWLVGWWKIIVSHHVCYWIDAHLEWLMELEFLEAKTWN